MMFTCVIIIKLHNANIPFCPKMSRNSCPIGRGRSVLRRSVTDVVANDAAISSNHPNEDVAATDTRIAIGAARAAPAVSSAI